MRGFACFLPVGVVLGATLAMGLAAGADLADREREIASGLRCPVCQNLSVADSPSQTAQQMRALIREQLQQGKSREEIERYFVSRYGEWILLAPTPKGFNLLAWVLPFVGIAAGGLGVYLVVQRWIGRQAAAAADSAAEPPPVDPVYVERLRRELEEREA